MNTLQPFLGARVPLVNFGVKIASGSGGAHRGADYDVAHCAMVLGYVYRYI